MLKETEEERVIDMLVAVSSMEVAASSVEVAVTVLNSVLRNRNPGTLESSPLPLLQVWARDARARAEAPKLLRFILSNNIAVHCILRGEYLQIHT